MIPFEFDYSRPGTVEEALGLLADGEAKVLAGGMSLIPMMKLRLAAPPRLIDVARLNELRGIAISGNEIVVGAATTHQEVIDSTLLRTRCPLLGEAASKIGDIQVRNTGTIGGSTAHNDPAADYPAALLALGARVELRSVAGKRSAGIAEFLVDTLTTALEPGEIITSIVVPVEEPGTGTAYVKMPQPASGYAQVGVAVRVAKQLSKIAWIRVGVTGVGPNAYRANDVESALQGASGTSQEVASAAALVANQIDVNSDIHASAAYRAQMAIVFARRAIQKALERIV